MPFWKAYYHITWSTRQRLPAIADEHEARLHGAIRGAAERRGAVVHALSGTADHVHIVASIPLTIAIATLIGELKGSSAHLANHEMSLGDRFSWSPGYGLFTLGPKQLARAVDYVARQKEHHANQTTVAALERDTV